MSNIIKDHLQKSLPFQDIPIPDGWEKINCNTSGIDHVIIKSNGSSSPLTISLPKSGCFKIHLGLYRGENRMNSMQVKCSSERFWKRVLPMSLLSDPGGNLQNADLGYYQIKAGEHFLIRTEFEWCAALAYIYLD